ncbi:von Willebrand factor type A domain protein [Leptospira yanagawae serovar Saopaulo str. Sao Paulo = ATCC 700523]|uniref:von Willebrand factor type A domain protein n=1 Tax=Leptospira yanagawae serovar Saopaulo str. Sao Paulo = ATCC 700523 TaxID=1249483 RepID=A0A5E8H864_9LEPT|nr:VWA domain-containing protein [Leptospira yanagawae]EOQ87032.1 von Willebrand factor type A domain protein [Leptospira yanagawae serovar Saopaulo str. Sao Paulo = ATCC 700523]
MDTNTIIIYGIITLVLGVMISVLKLFINHSAEKIKSDLPSLKNRIQSTNSILLFVRSMIFLLALFFAIESLYKVKSVDAETTKNFESSDILFVVDVSLSMNAIDVKPNRLKRFQDLSLRLLPELKGNRIGMIVFAGQSFSYCPLTSDVTAVSDYIKSLGVEMVGAKGTNLGKALEKVESVRKKSKNLQSMLTVIVTDGEDHEKQTLPKLEGEVVVWGIGTEEGGPIEFRDPSTGKGGFVTYDSNLVDSPYSDNVITSKLNAELLYNLADKYNGQYTNVSFYEDGAYQLLDKIDSMKKTKTERLERFKNEDGAHPFILISFFLLLLERILSVQMQKNPFFKSAIIIFLFFTTQNQIHAWELDPGGNAIERGKQAYENQNYNESEKEFSKAKEYIKDDPRLIYNESTSAYQLGKFSESKELLEKTINHPKANSELKSKAHFALGNIYSKLGQKKEALRSYLDSLKVNPNNQAAKKNIEHLTQKQNSKQNNHQGQGQPQNPNPSQKPKENQKKENETQNPSDVDRIMEPFSNDSILKNKRGGSFDNEKFW